MGTLMIDERGAWWKPADLPLNKPRLQGASLNTEPAASLRNGLSLQHRIIRSESAPTMERNGKAVVESLLILFVVFLVLPAAVAANETGYLPVVGPPPLLFAQPTAHFTNDPIPPVPLATTAASVGATAHPTQGTRDAPPAGTGAGEASTNTIANTIPNRVANGAEVELHAASGSQASQGGTAPATKGSSPEAALTSTPGGDREGPLMLEPAPADPGDGAAKTPENIGAPGELTQPAPVAQTPPTAQLFMKYFLPRTGNSGPRPAVLVPVSFVPPQPFSAPMTSSKALAPAASASASATGAATPAATPPSSSATFETTPAGRP